MNTWSASSARPRAVRGPGQARPRSGTAQEVHAERHRQYNPGWHLALDLRNMLLVSECVAKAALERTESRGGHTRDDPPVHGRRRWRKTLLVVCRVSWGDAARRSRHHLDPRGPGADA